MDTNTQILQELVEAINRPDWWTIGITSAITIINATIMVWLGWRQYKLQKQQTYAQEYGIYKKLYLLLKNANDEIDDFLISINAALWAPQHKSNRDLLPHKLAYIESLRKNLLENYTDYELKFSSKTFNGDTYLRILTLMSRIVRQTIESLDKDEVVLKEGMERISYEQGKEDEAYVYAIVEHFKNDYTRMVILQDCNTFRLLKNVVRCDNLLLKDIGNRFKID